MGLSEDRKDDEAACEQNRGRLTTVRGTVSWSLGTPPVAQVDSGLGFPWGLVLKAWDRASPQPPQAAFHSLLPVALGAVVQGKPPLDCSGSPRSKGSRGLGLYSRLGREEASRTL